MDRVNVQRQPARSAARDATASEPGARNVRIASFNAAVPAPLPHRIDQYAAAADLDRHDLPVQRVVNLAQAVVGRLYRVTLASGAVHVRLHSVNQAGNGIFVYRNGQQTLPISGDSVDEAASQNIAVSRDTYAGEVTGGPETYGFKIGQEDTRAELTVSDDHGWWLHYISVPAADQRHGIAEAMLRKAVADHNGKILASNQGQNAHEQRDRDDTRWLTQDGAAFVNRMVQKRLMEYRNPFA